MSLRMDFGKLLALISAVVASFILFSSLAISAIAARGHHRRGFHVWFWIQVKIAGD